MRGHLKNLTVLSTVDSKVHRRMAATRGKNNPRERAIRSALHHKGLRFRLHRRLLPNKNRTADIVFPRHKVAVFIDGCFWHGCPIHGTWPKKNAMWWRDKINQNLARDRDTDASLRQLGWRVVRIWEHEPIEVAVARITEVICHD